MAQVGHVGVALLALAMVRARGCDPCSGGCDVGGGVPTRGCRSIAMTLMMILPRYIERRRWPLIASDDE